MWLGKFETGYKGANTTTEARKNENNPSKIQIKPDVYSWRSIQVANAHLSSYNYKREYDSHMMKNTEWGSVAYLQHSQYGSHTSVRINNHSDYKTGYSAVSELTCGYTGTNEECNKYGTTSDITKPWNTNIGVKASTTGNVSGIYDMSGGAWEYMMGVMTNQEGIACSGKDESNNSGFQGPYCYVSGYLSNGVTNFLIDIRYYDTYGYSTVDEYYNRRILGDATGETGSFSNKLYGTQIRKISSWYQDESLFILNEGSWFIRGSRYIYGTNAGNFAFSHTFGSVASTASFRIVLNI